MLHKSKQRNTTPDELKKYNETDHNSAKTNRNNGPVRTGTEGWRHLQTLEKQFLWSFMSFMVTFAKFDSKGLEKETKCFIFSFLPRFLMDLYVSKLFTLFICYFHICQLNFR